MIQSIWGINLHQMVWLQTANAKKMQKEFLANYFKNASLVFIKSRKSWFCPGETEEEKMKGPLQPTHCTFIFILNRTRMNILTAWEHASSAIIYRSIESVWKCWVTQEIQVSMRYKYLFPPPTSEHKHLYRNYQGTEIQSWHQGQPVRMDSKQDS